MTALAYPTQYHQAYNPATGGYNEPQGPVLHTFFCRALYDYQSNDQSSLTFRKGDIIEVLTQLESGWWDGLLNDERGWFPSNYVVQISDEDAAQDLMRSGLLSAPSANGDRSSQWLPEHYSEQPPQRGEHGHAYPESSSDYWIPEVNQEGQIYYVNTATGETARDIPSDQDTDSNRQGGLSPSEPSPSTGPRVRSRSNSRAAESIFQSREGAGFGIRRRSGTPQPWIKMLTDDGMAYYYVNSETGETRWTPPSPVVTNGSGRLRSDSSATNADSNRISVYSDTSDIHPFFADPSLPGHQQTVSGQSTSKDSTEAERSARQLQEALLPSSTETFSELVTAARVSIRRIISPPSDPTQLSELVDDVVLSLRCLLYRAGTLITGVRLHSVPSDNDEIINNRLKPLQRKVTATLSKVVLSARAARLNSVIGISAIGRAQQDAGDLDQAVLNFVGEIERCDLDNLGSKRLTGVLISGEGAAGVGIGLAGAGVGGGWKGLGYVPLPADDAGPQRRLSMNLITEFQDNKSILDEKAQSLLMAYTDGTFSADGGGEYSSARRMNDLLPTGPMIRDASRDFLSRLFLFTSALGDMNVAQHVDVTGFTRNSQNSDATLGDHYKQTVDRARFLVRKLEATTQALYDCGSGILLAAQDPISALHLIASSVSFLMNHITAAIEIIEALYHVGYEQSTLNSSKRLSYGYDQSISSRMSALDLYGEDYMQSLSQAKQLSDDEELVDMAAAFSANPVRGVANFSPEMQGGEDGGYISEEFEETERPIMGSHSKRFDSTSHMSLGSGDHASITTVTEKHDDALHDNVTPNMDILLEDDPVVKSKPKPKSSKTEKIARFFGAEVPTKALEDAARPWYMKSAYPAADKIVNPDGTLRAATLPALIEHMTDHEFRDTNFIRIFLLTFKSFATAEEVVEALITRYHMEPPEGLTEIELAEWSKVKQEAFKIRALNVLKLMVTEDDVLEEGEETKAIVRIRDFARSIQEDSAPAKLLMTVSERALGDDEKIIKTLRSTVSDAAPPSILPKVGKKLKLLDIDATEMARQLTIIESNLYHKIRVTECLNRAKEQKVKNAVQDNIAIMIEHTNQVTTWINQQVLEKDDSKKRAAIIKYFVTVAEKCRIMNNFSTMAAMVSGLNTPPIRRLKRTWDQVGQRALAMLENCEKTFDSNKNFSNYRNTLTKIEPPCVPFLGVSLSTLVFINEGSKDILPPPPTQPAVGGQPAPAGPSGPLINFAKRQKAAEVIREIKNWQTVPYNLNTVPVVHHFIEDALNQCGKADMSDLFWEKSLALEPREREDEKMARLLQESGFL